MIRYRLISLSSTIRFEQNVHSKVFSRRRDHGKSVSLGRRHQSQSSSSSSYSADDCAHRAFAKTHPKAAADILAVPSYESLLASSSFPFTKTNDDDNKILPSSLEDYLQWRGWDIDGILHKHNLDAEVHRNSDIGLLSHPLTFPLTLGHWHVTKNSKVRDGDGGEERTDDKHTIRLCCVGARAECTLPDEFWREFLVCMATNNTSIGIGDGTYQKDFKYIIDFVGPDVPHHLKSKTITLGTTQEGGREVQEQNQSDITLPQWELTMNYHTSFLHQVVLQFLKASQSDKNASCTSKRIEKIQQYWNGGFVLFNPGLGHPHLQKGWEPTLKFLLGAGQPLLFTAHSALDANRDYELIRKILGEDDGRIDTGLLGYEVNPYASRMEFVDPFPPTSQNQEGVQHVVRPNHSYLMLH
mmetsp:Transcript_40056/g.84110  ORF Transcript_40056/g.84110 Transcript_40056/m.84110 type:complete len:412 (+) Transcript_40056:3-1238(+)